MTSLSISEIADYLQVSYECIHSYIQKLNLKGVPSKNNKNLTVILYPESEYNKIKQILDDNRKALEGFYTMNELAEFGGVTLSCISTIAKQFNIEKVVKSTGNGRKAYFSKESSDRILEIIELRRDKRYQASKKRKALITESASEDMKNHPLVTDPHFLILSYFPDVVPICFKELEQEEI